MCILRARPLLFTFDLEYNYLESHGPLHYSVLRGLDWLLCASQTQDNAPELVTVVIVCDLALGQCHVEIMTFRFLGWKEIIFGYIDRRNYVKQETRPKP